MPLKVLIADDHAMFRSGLAQIIQQALQPQIFEAANGGETLRMVQEHCPDIVLLDIDMPIMNGLDVLSEMEKLATQARSIVVSMHSGSKYIVKAMAAGAYGYISKVADPEEIIAAISCVEKGQKYFNEEMGSAMLESLRATNTTASQKVEFSQNDILILQFIADGLNNSEISKRVYLSERTIENIKWQMMRKCGIHNTLGLIVYAIRNKLIAV